NSTRSKIKIHINITKFSGLMVIALFIPSMFHNKIFKCPTFTCVHSPSLISDSGSLLLLFVRDLGLLSAFVVGVSPQVVGDVACDVKPNKMNFIKPNKNKKIGGQQVCSNAIVMDHLLNAGRSEQKILVEMLDWCST
ncbi:hypothetical protein L9F63_021849, partial [Diploptera punctata]